MIKILFWSSIILVITGIITAFIFYFGLTSFIPFVFIGALLSISVLVYSKVKHELKYNKKIINYFNSVFLTAIILSIVVAVNLLGIKYNIRWDFTEYRQDTLLPQSLTVIKKLKQPLKISIFDRQLDPNLENLLKKYRRANSKLQYQLVNPEREIGLAQQYGVRSLGEIYLQYGNKKQKLNLDRQTEEIITEAELTNNIEQIKRDRTINIYLLQGHGEADSRSVDRGIAQVVARLEKEGNVVSRLNLASSGTIPKNADLIVIAGATRKLLNAEVVSLQTYLSTGGNLLLLLSPNTNIGIASLLEEWGVELDNRLVIDGSGSGRMMGFGPGVAIVNQYGTHPITASFGNGISIFPESRPLKIIDKTEIKATPLAITSQKTWAESNLKNEEITFDAAKDLPGPLHIAIALKKERLSNSHMVIFGSSTFATNGWFEQQLNSDLLLNSIAWLVQKEGASLVIQPRESANRRINLSPSQIWAIDCLALFIFPCLPLIVAVFVWYKRRFYRLDNRADNRN